MTGDLTPEQADEHQAFLDAVAASTPDTSEIEELRQWMSDACELLHDINGDHVTDFYGTEYQDRLDGLLRRAENP